MHSPRTRAKAPLQPLAVSATPGPPIGEKIVKSRFSEEVEADVKSPSTIQSRKTTVRSNLSLRSAASMHSHTRETTASTGGGNPGRRHGVPRPIPAPDPIITISASASNTDDQRPSLSRNNPSTPSFHSALDDDLDYVTIDIPTHGPVENAVVPARPDKAARVLGIRHRQSMEPIPGSNRNSLASARSAPASVSAPPPSPSGPTMPLASLYVVSGLPKSPHTWTLADPDSVMGLHHSEGAVGRWWRPEVLGSTISPGAAGGKRKKKGKTDDGMNVFSSSGHLSKQDVGKMLSKALKVRRTRRTRVHDESSH